MPGHPARRVVGIFQRRWFRVLVVAAMILCVLAVRWHVKAARQLARHIQSLQPSGRTSSEVALTDTALLRPVRPPVLVWPPPEAPADFLREIPWLGFRPVLWQEPRFRSHAAVSMDWDPAASALEAVLVGLDRQGPDEVPEDTRALVLADAVTLALHQDRLEEADRRLLELLNLPRRPEPPRSLPQFQQRVRATTLGVEAVWQALQCEGFATRRLAVWQAALERNSLRGALVRCLELERTRSLELDARWRTEPGLAPWSWRLFWRPHDVLQHLDLMEAGIEAAREFEDGAPWSALRYDLSLANERFSPSAASEGSQVRAFSRTRLEVGALDAPGILEGAAVAETWRQLGVVALAIERHRRTHGSYPARLYSLQPGALKEAAIDPMAAQSLRYFVGSTPSGQPQPLLYSLGPNGTDEGGHPWPQPEDAWSVARGSLGGRDLCWPEAFGPPVQPGAADGEVLPILAFDSAMMFDVIRSLGRSAQINFFFDPSG